MTDNTLKQQVLPPLPYTNYNGYSDGSEPLYTAEQMHDYALAALDAAPVQPAKVEVVGYLHPDEIYAKEAFVWGRHEHAHPKHTVALCRCDTSSKATTVCGDCEGVGGHPGGMNDEGARCETCNGTGKAEASSDAAGQDLGNSLAYLKRAMDAGRLFTAAINTSDAAPSAAPAQQEPINAESASVMLAYGTPQQQREALLAQFGIAAPAQPQEPVGSASHNVGLLRELAKASVGACNCGANTPLHRQHAYACRYRVIEEARAVITQPAAQLPDAEFLSKRLARVAKLVGYSMPFSSHEQVAEAAGTILGEIARKLESWEPAAQRNAIIESTLEEVLDALNTAGEGSAYEVIYAMRKRVIAGKTAPEAGGQEGGAA
jgi:hypothetical protein